MVSKVKSKEAYIGDLTTKLTKLELEVDRLQGVKREYLAGIKFKSGETGEIELEEFAVSLAKFLLSNTKKYNVKPLGALSSNRFVQYFYNQKANRIQDEINLKLDKITRLKRDIENNKLKLEKLCK